MKWCCIGFQSHYDTAGERGHAILIGRDSMGQPEITMQYRAIDPSETLPVTDIPISTVVDIRIVFCPWCGQNVETWYGKDVDTLYRDGLKITP
jgi:hypothetical protein